MIAWSLKDSMMTFGPVLQQLNPYVKQKWELDLSTYNEIKKINTN